MPDIFRNNRYIFFLCAIVAAASLSACSPTSGEPVSTPSSSETSLSTSATTTPATDPTEAASTQTELPIPRPGMDVDSVDGATAFAYYFFDVLNYTAASGDTALLQEISGPDCVYCSQFTELVSKVHSEGASFKDFNASASNLQYLRQAGTQHAFTFSQRETAYSITESSELAGSYQPTDRKRALVMEYQGSTWTILGAGSAD